MCLLTAHRGFFLACHRVLCYCSVFLIFFISQKCAELAACSSSTSPGYSYSLTSSWTSSFLCSPLMNHVSLHSSLFDSDTVLTSCASEGQPSSSCSASLPCISRYPLSAPSVTTTICSLYPLDIDFVVLVIPPPQEVIPFAPLHQVAFF